MDNAVMNQRRRVISLGNVGYALWDHPEALFQDFPRGNARIIKRTLVGTRFRAILFLGINIILMAFQFTSRHPGLLSRFVFMKLKSEAINRFFGSMHLLKNGDHLALCLN